MNREKILELSRHIERARDVEFVENEEKLEFAEVCASSRPLSGYNQDCWVVGDCGCIAGHAIALFPDEALAIADDLVASSDAWKDLPPPTGHDMYSQYWCMSGTTFYRVAKRLLGLGVDDAWWVFAPTDCNGPEGKMEAVERLTALYNHNQPEGDLI